MYSPEWVKRVQQVLKPVQTDGRRTGCDGLARQRRGFAGGREKNPRGGAPRGLFVVLDSWWWAPLAYIKSAILPRAQCA